MTFQIVRSDVSSRPLVGMGFTTREAAERSAEMWRAHWADYGIEMELEVREVTGTQQEDAIRAIRVFYGKVRGW